MDKGLLDLGEDREKFGYIQSAAQDLAKKLLENRLDLIAAASVVLGGDLPDDDSTMSLCKQAITVHWQTYGSRLSTME
ncbi:GTPase-associated system all-helical protein GASH [Acidobacterium sp. S8]|uniref:GTPase-associated system all-helical protein GASH n=1 Tax=Acidobacterium sp. S8 TaxID=1641854 RepID=UPI00352E8822